MQWVQAVESARDPEVVNKLLAELNAKLVALQDDLTDDELFLVDQLEVGSSHSINLFSDCINYRVYCIPSDAF